MKVRGIPLPMLVYQTDAGKRSRQMAQREVMQVLSSEHEKALNNPELSTAYYDAITLLLSHWKPGERSL